LPLLYGTATYYLEQLDINTTKNFVLSLNYADGKPNQAVI